MNGLFWGAALVFVFPGFSAAVNLGGWSAAATVGAPAPRTGHAAVWTGTKMIVWGGEGFGTSDPLNSGGVYDPVARSWSPVSTAGAPGGRAWTSVVWSGSEMLVWGGQDAGGTPLNTGARYNPQTSSWIAMSTVNAPSARGSHTAVWIGGNNKKMIVWGGYGAQGQTDTGGIYDPATDTWTALPLSSAPAARWQHTAVATDSRMFVWGGVSQDGTLANGAVFDVGSNSWSPMSTTGAPSLRQDHVAVMGDTRMYVWGGVDASTDAPVLLNTGAAYDPSLDAWTPLPTDGAPEARSGHTMVWTGSKMIVWGGMGAPDSGGLYTPPDVHSGFVGEFARTTWAAHTIPPRKGSVMSYIYGNPPRLVLLTDPTRLSAITSRHAAAYDARVRFNWLYWAPNDASQNACPARYFVTRNGSTTYTTVSQIKPYTLQGGNAEFAVKKGDQFGFALNGTDGAGCPSKSPRRLAFTIKDLLVVPE